MVFISLQWMVLGTVEFQYSFFLVRPSRLLWVVSGLGIYYLINIGYIRWWVEWRQIVPLFEGIKLCNVKISVVFKPS